MKMKHVMMALGLVCGLGLLAFGDKSSDSDVAAPVKHDKPTQAHTVVTSTPVSQKVAKNATIMELVAREKLISVGHVGLDGKPVNQGSTLFATQSWAPPPPVATPVKDPGPPPAPTAPPLNFTFIGKKFEDGVWEVYLAKGVNSYVVRNNSVIDGTYHVDAVTPTAVTMTYLPLNQVQQLNIKG